MECIFCKIVKKEMAADVLWEDQDTIVFRDIHPKAPTHVLVVPKAHIPSLSDAGEEDRAILGKVLLAAKKVAKDVGIEDSGWKTVINVGRGGGQLIDHLHLHVLGGWETGASRELP